MSNVLRRRGDRQTVAPAVVGFASAVHDYDVSAALTCVTDGDILPQYLA